MARTKKARIVNAGSLNFTSSGKPRNGTACEGSSSSTEKSEVGEESACTRILADDMLLHVLHYLPTRSLLSSAALVCHRWRRLCCSHLVRELVPPPFSSYERPWGSLREKDIMELAICHASTLEKLSLHGFKHLKGDQILSLIARLPKLKELAIISCPMLTSADMEEIARSLPSDLTNLDLHVDHLLGAHMPQPYLYDSFITSLQKGYFNLEKLDLDTHSYITPQALDSLLNAMPNLLSLDLHSHLIGWAEVKMIFRKCTSLVHFSLVSSLLSEALSSSDEEDGRGFLGRRKFSMQGRSRNLLLAASEEFNLRSVIPASLCSLRLYSFQHQSLPLDSPSVASLLKENGHRLRHLYAQSVFNTSWHTISVWCANLQTLDLSHSRDKQLFTTGIEEVVLCGLPRLLKSLVRIGLPSVTDRILVELGRFCSKLREIHIEGYGSGNSCAVVQGSVTDRGVVALSEGCSDLQVLSLAGCRNVTISSLRALTFHCHGLKVLYMTGCLALKDDAVATLLSRLGNSLQLLDLGGCSKITLAAVKQFVQHVLIHGTSLRVLALQRSLWNASKSEVSKLKECAPHLSIRAASCGIPWDGFHHSRCQIQGVL